MYHGITKWCWVKTDYPKEHRVPNFLQNEFLWSKNLLYVIILQFFNAISWHIFPTDVSWDKKGQTDQIELSSCYLVLGGFWCPELENTWCHEYMTLLRGYMISKELISKRSQDNFKWISGIFWRFVMFGYIRTSANNSRGT